MIEQPDFNIDKIVDYISIQKGDGLRRTEEALRAMHELFSHALNKPEFTAEEKAILILERADRLVFAHQSGEKEIDVEIKF